MPPLDIFISDLHESYQSLLTTDALTGLRVGELLMEWRRDDPLVASALNDFFDQMDEITAQLLAQENPAKLDLQLLSDAEATEHFEYELIGDDEFLYWAHVFLVLRGYERFEKVEGEIFDE
jgi:hypothetical protein